MNYSREVAHLFRHEYGQLVATLLRRVGGQQIEVVEDAVQYAMLQALDAWCRNTIPDKPAAWLYQVAYRYLMSELRNSKRRQQILVEQESDLVEKKVGELAEIPLSGEMSDAMLRMLFVTCHDAIPIESQLVFTLKSLCGFNVPEIALRLFTTEENVYKRYGRAKNYFKKHPQALDNLIESDWRDRLSTVHRVIYLLFTEGYFSSHPDNAIRQDLCEEAKRLVHLINESRIGGEPETLALLALMHFHLARINTRQDDSGALMLLEQQERSQWDEQAIKKGMAFLQQSAQGEIISRYHVEANIAAEHCLAPSFQKTRWDRIVASYELLERIAPSALYRLNRAIALAEWKGAKAGLAILQAKEIPVWLQHSYHWYAVLADLYYRSGEISLAHESAERALNAAPNAYIKQLLIKRLARY